MHMAKDKLRELQPCPAMKCALALCLSALAAASCLTLRAPLQAPHRAPLHAPRRATLPLMNELQKEVEQRRLFRRVGVGTGVALLSGGLGVGVVAGVLDGNVVGGAFSAVGIVGSALFGAYTFSFEESREPYSPVAPAESAPGMGSGLFATADIPKDTFLFDYEGERLTEPEMFERYPDGQGRCVAMQKAAALRGFGQAALRHAPPASDQTQGGL